MAAPCFATFERWPNGPKYAPAGFRPVWASTKDKKGDKTTANTFEYRTARGPLRFDDWLEIGIGGVVEGDDEKRWRVPDAVQRFTNNADPIADELDKRGGLDPSLVTTLKGELPFRVRAMAVVVEGKAPVASSTRELPLWRLPADVRTDLIHQVTNVVTEVGAIAKVLAEQARNCLKLADGMKAAEVGAALEDALKAMMDEAVVELPRRLVAEPDRAKTAALGDEVVAAAVDTAYRLFDESFPVTGIDKPSLAAAKARRMLRGRLNKLDPRQRGNSKQKPGKQKGKP